MGECFFCDRPTRVVPDKEPLNSCVCVCVLFNEQNERKIGSKAATGATTHQTHALCRTPFPSRRHSRHRQCPCLKTAGCPSVPKSSLQSERRSAGSTSDV